jgi:nucleoid-associated protein YgaU
LLLLTAAASAQHLTITTEIIDYAAIEKAKADAAHYSIINTYNSRIDSYRYQIAMLKAKIERDQNWKKPRPVGENPQTASELMAQKLAEREHGDGQAYYKVEIARYEQLLARTEKEKAAFQAGDKAYQQKNDTASAAPAATFSSVN